MAYVIYGAGAIGGIIAARLARQRHDVVVIARGANRAALDTGGLRLQAEADDWRGPVRVAGHPADIGLTSEDIVLLAMKTQDTLAAIEDLAVCAPSDMPIFCAQNGVENERIALRRFQNVYGMYVFVFGTNPVPGTVQCFTAPSYGVLDLGRYPDGLDDVAVKLADVLVNAGFDTLARADIMQWKRAKLIANLGNALAAGYGALAGVADLYEAAQSEGRACYRAAGIAFVSAEESARRYRELMPLKLVGGAPFPGGSAWQSLARGAGRTEIDYLTGEIVLLGRLHGVATPVNSALQRLVRRMLLDQTPPASLDPNDLREQLTAEGVVLDAAASL
jgi:2-dehydropantoate 2-reductase